MMNTLFGKKIDQTQKFLENGQRVPVTVISVNDNAVLQVKTAETDAYSAVQLGVGVKKKPTKASAGHAKKAGFDTVASFVREVRVADGDELPAVGESVAVETVFAPGDIVSVTGISKGKGFAGAVKRYGFGGGPKTHGQSDRHRAPGSIGQGTTPGRVYKGKRMAGRMGSDQVTVANLTVVAVDPETKTILVAGLVPGHKQAIVTITKTGEKKKFVELLEEKVKREAKEAEEAEKARIEAEKTAKEAESASASPDAKAMDDKEASADKEEAAPVATAEPSSTEVTEGKETVAEATEAVEAPADDKGAESVAVEPEVKVAAEEAAVEEEVKETEETNASASSAQRAEEAEAASEAEEAEKKEETK